jgi:hypothetical protein
VAIVVVQLPDKKRGEPVNVIQPIE